MANEKIDIAIACSAWQNVAWWGRLAGTLLQEAQRGLMIGQIIAVSSALPDHNKNSMVGGRLPFASSEEKGRNERTDANRVAATKRFLEGDTTVVDAHGDPWRADWLMWFDDDTVMPSDVITRLLSLKKIAVGGLYFNPSPPYNPIAYVRSDDGIGYHALYDYPEGMLVEVDSIGMGCTLTHRSVFERIAEYYDVWMRPNDSFLPVPKSAEKGDAVPFLSEQPPSVREVIVDGWHCQRVRKPHADDDRPWPYFAMEYGRTEDHHFWELAAKVGIKPWVDTNIQCGHLKPREVSYQNYKDYINAEKGLR